VPSEDDAGLWLQQGPKGWPVLATVAIACVFLVAFLAGKTTMSPVIARANLIEFLPRVFDYIDTYGADLVRISGFGPQFAAFGLLAMVAVALGAFRKDVRSRGAWLVAATALALFVLLLFINFNSNSYRILSFLPMAMIPFAAIALHRHGMLDSGGSKTLINLMLLGCIIWNAALTLPPSYSNLRRFKEFVGMDAEFRTSANFTQWFGLNRPSMYRLLEHLPPEKKIAYLADRNKTSTADVPVDIWSYLYYDRHWQRDVSYLYLPNFLDCNDDQVCTVKPGLKQHLANNDIQYLSSCKTNRCMEIDDTEFAEIVPGFYRYRAAQ
jgi:hypothetical protein